MKPFWEIPVEEWDRLMAVNLRGPFLLTSALLPSLAGGRRRQRRQRRLRRGVAGPPRLSALRREQGRASPA